MRHAEIKEHPEIWSVCLFDTEKNEIVQTNGSPIEVVIRDAIAMINDTLPDNHYYYKHVKKGKFKIVHIKKTSYEYEYIDLDTMVEANDSFDERFEEYRNKRVKEGNW